MSDDFDAAALLAALDQTAATGVPPHLVEQLRALVRFTADHPRSAPPRVEMEGGLRARFPEFDRLVRAWAADPMPKVPGLQIFVRPHLGYYDAPMGLEVSLRAEHGFHLTAFQVTSIYGLGEIHGEHGIRLADLLMHTLDEMHREIVRGFRTSHGAAPEAGRSYQGPDGLIRVRCCGRTLLVGTLCPACGELPDVR